MLLNWWRKRSPRHAPISSRTSAKRLRPRSQRPSVEHLEDRCVPATIMVLNSNDAGPDSLRAAIITANIANDVDVIQFNIAGAGVHTINVATALPAITQPVTIDGTTQPGFAGTPVIELNGTNAGNASNGIRINGINTRSAAWRSIALPATRS